MAKEKKAKKPKKEHSGAAKFFRVLLVIVLLALSGVAIWSQVAGFTSPIESTLSGVITPIQRVFSGALDGLYNYMAKIKLRSNIEQEYNKLKAQNDELIYQALLNSELQNENDRLRALLGEYDAKASMNPILAHVSSSETGNWFSTFTIDKGSNDGITSGNAVITSDGLIGHVYEVFATTSKVITIIDNDSAIAGLIESSRDQGLVQGALGTDGEAICRMYYLSLDSVPRPGDSVITSGSGVSFPKGLLIGYVRESTRSLESNKHYIVIEPAADFKHIEEVLVLRYEPEVEALPDYNDDDIILVPLETKRPQVVIDDTNIVVTPVPIPDAPGRVTPTPSPPQADTDYGYNLSESTPWPDATANADFDGNEQEMLEAFLADE